MSLDSITTTIDDAVSDFFDPVATTIGDIVFYTVPVAGTDLPLIVAWLVIAGLVFTAWFGLIQARKLKLAFDVVRGRYDEKDSPARSTTSRRSPPPSPAPSASATSPVWPSPSPSAVRAPPSG